MPDIAKLSGGTFYGLQNNNNAYVYQSGNMSSVYRIVNCPLPNTDFYSISDQTAIRLNQTGILSIQVAGAPSSTSVAKYTYTYVYEAVSTADMYRYA